MKKIAIVGSGLMGRVLVLTLLQHDPSITIDLFERDQQDGNTCCGYAAAGMLAPFAEMAIADKRVFDWGEQSVTLWAALLDLMGNRSQILKQSGTLIVAHSQDEGDFHHVTNIIRYRCRDKDAIATYDKQALSQFEPELNAEHFHRQFLHFAKEAHIHVPQFFTLSSDYLRQHPQIVWHQNCEVNTLQPYFIQQADNTMRYDCVFDCRGLGAKADLANLYGIRGEACIIFAPDIHLRHVIRLVHPRYPLYVVPYGDGHYYVGATSIVGEDISPISVQSLMTLLSALFVIDKRFAEARIIKTISHCRPSSDNDLPIHTHQPGLVRLNGLSRHGYLTAPILALKAINKTTTMSCANTHTSSTQHKEPLQ